MPASQSAPPTILKKMPFTQAMMLINIIIFTLAYIKAGTLTGQNWTITLLRFGAQFSPLALDKEWYRIFTHMFLHGSIIQLATNMLALLYLGYALEEKIGTKKFGLIYLIAGAASALSSLYWSLFIIGVGASGAVLGLLGFSLVLNIYFSGKSVKSMVILLIALSAYVCINMLTPDLMHSDYPAHFGGIITGILIGFYSFAKGNPDIRRVKVEYYMILSLILLYFLIPRYQLRYFNFFRQVVAAEDTTKNLVKEKLTDDDMRVFIRNYHHWDDILTLLRDQTNLPVALASDTFKLRNYIDLRKKENLYKKIVVQHERYAYLDSVEHLHEVMQKYLDLDYGLWSRVKMEEHPPDSLALSKMVKVLYDSNGAEISSPPAAYYRVGFKDSLGRWDGSVTDYYGNGNTRMKGTYTGNRRDGVFLFYSEHKTHTAAGRYLDDKPFGKWETFHDNGRLAKEMLYTDPHFVKNLWDSLGNQLVVDGNGREIERYPNGVVAVEGEYRHGLKEGYWYGHYPNGQMHFEENFNQGRLVTGKSRSPEGETFVYDVSSLYPIPEGGFEKFNAYVKSETKKVDDELGHVKISFRVTRKGSLADVVIVQGASPTLDAKAKEILLTGPRWLPARNHGHEPVDAEGFVQIEFY